jgi:hypothetical protein
MRRASAVIYSIITCLRCSARQVVIGQVWFQGEGQIFTILHLSDVFEQALIMEQFQSHRIVCCRLDALTNTAYSHQLTETTVQLA